ncbi:antimicrobial peptide system SdpA family protein [Mycolicibacterium mucogenicum 261Sha1.1M5]|nr:antimicrobial peptide system SdpA family protein [Mycolicibacterium mucogenicum 261Sha1.1M5]
MKHPFRSRPSSVVMVFALTTLLVGATAVSSFVGNKIPSNVFSPRAVDNPALTISQTFIQGWGFFTRDAREDRVSIAVSPDGSSWRVQDLQPAFSASNSYGLSRQSRAESLDLNHLYAAVPLDTDWKECSRKESTNACLQNAPVVGSVDISPASPGLVCSSFVGLLRETPVPYAYKDLTREMKSRAVQIEVECK